MGHIGLCFHELGVVAKPIAVLLLRGVVKEEVRN